MLKSVLAVTLAFLLESCANVAYYTQAVGGHLRVMQAAEPIPRIIHDPSTAPSLRKKLEKTAEIREFASRELALPENGSYRSYADLGRPYVVWNVFAAKELSMDLEEWCLLFVGCVNYRGYYDRAAAEDFARGLRARGLETYVANIPAYSTLGFFDDPVLNTFLRFGEEEVARTVFHELAHQVVFVRGDSSFNESFATTVETEGMRRWLAHQADPARFREFEARQQRKARFKELVTEYSDRLREIYSCPWPEEEKRRAKQETLDSLRLAYARLKSSWGGASGYDAFFDAGLNNARLGSVGLYTKLVPAFEALLEQVGHDLPAFYRRVEDLAHLDKEERRAALDLLLDAPRLNFPRQTSSVVGQGNYP
ncbi:MAG: aminopeptidase [Rhodocyclaceae bacterium]|nr:aminopeptidase [Rhodocyclaceae bacterium]